MWMFALLFCFVASYMQRPTWNATTIDISGILPPDLFSKGELLEQISGPHHNYFHSNNNSNVQLVITSPLDEDVNNTIRPRVLAAWPAGNAGVVAYFNSLNGSNDRLGISLSDNAGQERIIPIYEPSTIQGSNAIVGVTTYLKFNASAVLSHTILGSVRTIRDFVEGRDALNPDIRNTSQISPIRNGFEITQRWLDNTTETRLAFTSLVHKIELNQTTVTFGPGTYKMDISYNYPQLEQLSINSLLKNGSNIDKSDRDSIKLLSFLSYTNKITAGGWRFLTYFGRDSLISALLLEPILSVGEGGAMEAALTAAIERIDRITGSVCHEEVIGDYATWLNLKDEISEDHETSTKPSCDYTTIDTDFYLPILLQKYLVQNEEGRYRAAKFLAKTSSFWQDNSDVTFSQLVHMTARKIFQITSAFAEEGGQIKDNLLRLQDGYAVGQWRDSTYGLGGGRIPFDVNTALVPAALRAIASLVEAEILCFERDSRQPFDAAVLNKHAQIWEDSSLTFFESTLSAVEARSRLEKFVGTPGSAFQGLDSQTNLLDQDRDLKYYALALDGHHLPSVEVMHTDDAFRHLLLNTTNQSQLTAFINITASNIRRRFPAGLMTDVGMIVANPAYGSDPVYAANFTPAAYHGTVVWSWQLAMMARGIELQLSRCGDVFERQQPDFCRDQTVLGNVQSAYTTLWDNIERNKDYMSMEVYGWKYNRPDDKFEFVDFSTLPPAPGTTAVEADIIQLWSLTFLAVKRNTRLEARVL